MRVEGATTDEWLAEAERGRQLFRLLAERADIDSQLHELTGETEETKQALAAWRDNS